MVDPTEEDTEEKPLDPAVARIQARLQRLMLIAGLTLGVGILAVFLAIIYRIVVSDDKAGVAMQSEPASAVVATTSGQAGAGEAVVEPKPEVASSPGGEVQAGEGMAVEPISGPEARPTATVSTTEPASNTPPAQPMESTSAGETPIPVPSPRLPPLGDPGSIETGSVQLGTDAAVLATKASVPADARLVASTVAGGRIVLTYDHFNGTILLVVDPETLQVVGRLDVEPR